jgi:hypothetical protein
MRHRLPLTPEGDGIVHDGEGVSGSLAGSRPIPEQEPISGYPRPLPL